MVVRLFTTDGMKWIYRTHNSKGGGDDGPLIYFTKCGLEWDTEPKPYETCDHIDCAIEVQRKSSNGKGASIILSFLFIGYILFNHIKEGDITAPVIAGIILFAGFFILMYIFKDDKMMSQLTEYNHGGTINGMSAYRDHSFDELIELDDAKECINYGLFQYNKGKYDDAIRAFDKAVKLNPRSAAAWNNKGIALKALNRYDEAITACEMALRLDPRYADAWHQKGLSLYDQKRYDEAVYAYDQAIEAKPNDADILHGKGMALRMLGRLEEADKILKSARNEWNSKGMDLFLLERHIDALKAYDKALLIDPKFLCAWVNKGTALTRMGRYDEAIAAFNHAIEINPQDSHAWNRKGLALKKIRRVSEAEDAFARAKGLGFDGW